MTQDTGYTHNETTNQSDRWFQHFKFDLCNEYLQIIVVFEIQDLVTTRIMHILNFFVAISDAYDALIQI